MAVTENNSSKFKKCALALAVASCMSLATTAAEAAGLGKLTVFSSLGQPLKAEVELSATGEELIGMNARLAPPDIFKQAGVEYSSALTDLRFAVERRSNGKSVLRVSSARPVNEPFLDFLVELTWPAGRLVREYTFLLDPPEFASGQGMRTSVDAKIVETVRGGGAAPETVAPPPKRAEVAAVTPVAKAPEKAPAGDSSTRLVERGDTLLRIANERRYASVSLEQMLVGLYRNNREAFIENDINRLKAGVILNVPDEASVAAVSEKEARAVYVSAGDFAAYRRKLAAAAAEARAESPAAQSAAGKITPKVEEKTPAVDSARDQVKVSRADAPAGTEVDRIAADKALQESQARVTQLERNLTEIQKLLEMKNQRLAELEKPAPAVEAAVPETKPAETPVEPAAQQAVPATEASTTPAPAEPAQPAAAEPPAAETKPPVAPAPVVPEAPVEEDSLLDNALPLAGGAAAIALLTGLLLYRRRRKPDALGAETTAAPSPSSLGPNSVFRMTGGQSVDTASTPPHTGEFSQAGPGTIDTDEVDPVAEADVYMAYGRDAQAEEILLEAMQKDPSRLAIHAKLLEIYANRRSIKQFETLASELYAQTAGVGPEWEKVAALGAEIDPENPLYGGAAQSAKPSLAKSFDADATLVASTAAVAAATAAAATLDVPERVDSPVQTSADDALVFETPTFAEPEFDTEPEPALEPTSPMAAEFAAAEPADDGMALDFDLGNAAPVAELTEEAGAAAEAELSLSVPRPAEPYVDTVVTGESTPDALDFDLSGMVGGDSSLGAVALDAEPQDKGLDALDLPPLDAAVEAPAATVEDEFAAADPAHDFSPEGTLVISNAGNFGQAVDTGDFALDELPEVEAGAVSVEEMPEADDLAALVSTSVTPVVVEEDTPVEVPAEASKVEAEIAAEPLTMDAPDLVNTIVNPMALGADDMDFDVKLSDSVFLGQPMMPSEFDIGSINLDLSAEPSPTATESADLPEPAGLSLASAGADESAAEVHDAQWEEVNTKLDLAKAYEEMGDLEGARELLQEVLNEGSGDLVEQAQSILERIGG